MNCVLYTETEPRSSVGQLLQALGARSSAVSLEEMIAADKPGNTAVILSESQFLAVSGMACSRGCTFRELVSGFTGVLIYPFSGSTEALRALGDVIGGQVSAVEVPDTEPEYAVDGSRELCGPFSGLRIPGVRAGADRALVVRGTSSPMDLIIKNKQGGLLTRFKLPGLDLFVLSSSSVFDPTAEYQKNLDIRECFSSLVPLLFFLRRCDIEIPRTPLRWANWIIDDPNLTPRYGFLNIKDLAGCIREMKAAATIAFIPWNYSRTDLDIVRLFKESWPKLSICVHGCDHTGSEFSTRTMMDALPLVDLAASRMHRLHAETSLGYERVMVFPQGRFSAEAMRALRASEMLAAVNTELLDCQTGKGVPGQELLRPAITAFGGFPLFLRRPAEEHIANFALDILLGKPCLIVTHHPYFENGVKALQSTVASLNAIEPELTWTNLEHGISSTYSLEAAPERTSIRLYSAKTTLRPRPGETLILTKSETDPETVEVFVNGQPISSRRARGELEFALNGSPGGPLTIEARATVRGVRPQTLQSPKYRLKVTARRYLTEVRDNYLYRFPRLSASASSVQKLLYR